MVTVAAWPLEKANPSAQPIPHCHQETYSQPPQATKQGQPQKPAIPVEHQRERQWQNNKVTPKKYKGKRGAGRGFKEK